MQSCYCSSASCRPRVLSASSSGGLEWRSRPYSSPPRAGGTPSRPPLRAPHTPLPPCMCSTCTPMHAHVHTRAHLCWGTLQTQRSPVGRAGSARTRTRTRTHSLPASPADGDARPSGVCSARRAVPFSCRHRCPRQPGPPRRARARGGRCARLSSPPRHAEDPCSQGRGSRNCTHSQQPICSPRPHGSPRIHHPRPWEAPDLVSQGPVRSPLAASWLRAGNRAATGGPTPAIAGHSSTPPTAETPLLSASPWPLRGLPGHDASPSSSPGLQIRSPALGRLS